MEKGSFMDTSFKIARGELDLVKNVNLDFDKINGSHLQGHIHTTYANLVNKLGKPHIEHRDSKVDVEWSIEFNNGTIATIYNYKDGVAYLGKEGAPTEKITDWHIGGHNKKALEYVHWLLSD